jgi:hypothetical protein
MKSKFLDDGKFITIDDFGLNWSHNLGKEICSEKWHEEIDVFLTFFFPWKFEIFLILTKKIPNKKNLTESMNTPQLKRDITKTQNSKTPT